jgi:hypothetical protein
VQAVRLAGLGRTGSGARRPGCRATGADHADNQVPPPDETARGQLLRLMASDAMRAAAERHFGVRLAFQNCHRVAVFRPAATQALAEFTTARAQLLNQSPELTNC